MSCEQELNSDGRTCIFIPEIQDLATETMSCPDGFRRFDDKSVIPSAPICIQTSIPSGYTCQNPLRCMRPRPTSTPIVESFHDEKNNGRLSCCGKGHGRCPYKSQVTTINQVRDRCLQFCYSDPRFVGSNQDMYSSPCGKFCQKLVDQTILKYGYSPCEKKIQPAVHWYQ